MPGRDPLEAAYERRIRLASEVATWGIAAILVASAALPTTPSITRLGLLFSAALLGIFGILWFHVIPERIFGPLRFTIGTALTQLVGAILLMLTGGGESNYFVFFMFPTLATTFAMRVVSTLVVGSIGLISLVAIIVGDGVFENRAELFQLGAVRVSAFVALIAMTALIARTMQETRAALRQRSNELASQNVELEVSHSTALAIARARDLGELLRAVFDAASTAIGAQRVFFFEGAEASERSWTIGAEGAFQSFDIDRRQRDSPRQRAMRSRRTIVVNDMADEPMVSERVKTSFGVGSGLFVPLIHRGGLVGLVTFVDPKPRTWTAREVRSGGDRRRVGRAVGRVLPRDRGGARGARGPGGPNEGPRGHEPARGGARARAGRGDDRTGRRTSRGAGLPPHRRDDPVRRSIDRAARADRHRGRSARPSGRERTDQLPGDPQRPRLSSERPDGRRHLPVHAVPGGSGGYVCVPLLAGGEPIGALFMEPTVGSVVEDTFVRAAADRVALSLANRRVLETAQRQATTDGLTGLSNRHLLREQLKLLQSLATRHGQPYSVIAFDVDGLKQVNDTFGHEMGDLALRGLANVVRKTIRTSDIGVRTGGDEFLILIPLGGLEQARILAERLRDALAAQGRAEPHTAMTVSAGVAAWRVGRTGEQVLEAADEMLYAAKRAGRDRVVVESAPAAAESGPASP